MGAETSSLQDLKLDESVTQTADKAWTLHSANVDGERVSVFVYETSPKQSSAGFMENAAKQLKLLRHPYIVRFLSWKKTATGGQLVTEPVKPLESVIDSLTALEISAGLYNVIDAVTFLHDKGGISHNNISLSSIFVSEDGSWKLGGMECVCSFDKTTPSFLQSCAALRDKQSIPPEERKSITLQSKELKHARDAYALGVLCQNLLAFLQELDIPIDSFEAKVEEYLSPDPKKRPKVHLLLDDSIFRNEFLEIVNFLRQITLKSELEKKVFFESIVEKLYALPQDVVAARLARPLLSRFVLLDATACEELLPHLLTPCKERGTYDFDEKNPILCEELFRIHLIPELFKIFHVRDAHIRMALLQHFHSYSHLFDRRALRTIILPQILLGVKDTNDNLVASSLHALAHLVPVLGGNVVIGCSQEKIFSEGKPTFSVAKQANGNVDPKRIIPMSSRNGETLLSQAKLMDKETSRAKAREKKMAERKAENQRRREERMRNRQLRESANNMEEKTANSVLNISADADEKILNDGEIQNDTEAADDDDNWSGWDKDENDDDVNVYHNRLGETVDAYGSDDNRSYNNTVITSSVKTNSVKNSAKYEDETYENLQLKKPKNPLRLSKPKQETCNTTDVSNVNDVQNGGSQETFNSGFNSSPSWGDNWDSQSKSTDSPAAANSTANTSTDSSRSKSKASLGEEFDIMSLDIKVSKSKSPEMDFFAEMEPEIKSSGMNLLETLAAANSQQSAEGSNMPTSLTDLDSAKFSTMSKFNFAIQSDAKDETGWGDETWDEEFPDIEES